MASLLAVLAVLRISTRHATVWRLWFWRPLWCPQAAVPRFWRSTLNWYEWPRIQQKMRWDMQHFHGKCRKCDTRNWCFQPRTAKFLILRPKDDSIFETVCKMLPEQAEAFDVSWFKTLHRSFATVLQSFKFSSRFMHGWIAGDFACRVFASLYWERDWSSGHAGTSCGCPIVLPFSNSDVCTISSNKLLSIVIRFLN